MMNGKPSASKAANGLFVTTSTFRLRPGHRRHAEQGTVLIDGRQLAKLMIRPEVGCRVVETLTLKKEDEDFFEQVGQGPCIGKSPQTNRE